MLERRYLCSCSPGSWIHNARYSVQMERRPTVGRHLERGGTTAVSRARSQATTFNHTPIYRQISPSYQFFLLNLVQRLAQMIMNNLLTCCNIILSHASCTRRYIRVRYVCGAVSCSFFFFFYFYLHSTCLSVHVYNIYTLYIIQFSFVLFLLDPSFFFNLFVSFLFFFFLVFLLVFAPICTDHRVALYREHLSIVPIKEEVRTKPVPGANSFDQSTDRPINQPHRNHGT